MEATRARFSVPNDVTLQDTLQRDSPVVGIALPVVGGTWSMMISVSGNLLKVRRHEREDGENSRIWSYFKSIFITVKMRF